MVDVRQSTDVILGEMATRFAALRRCYQEPGSEGPSASFEPDTRRKEAVRLEDFRALFQEMMKDLQCILESTRQQRRVSEGRRDNLETNIQGNQGYNTDSSTTFCTNVETLVSQLKNTIETAVQPLGIEQRRLIQICETIQAQGDDCRAVLDFVKEMTKAQRAEMFDSPRLACLLPPWTFENNRGLSGEEQKRQTWESKLREGIKKKKGFFTKEMRLFLVCARTHRLVPCGVRGQGYIITEVRDLVRKTFGVMKVAVELTSLALGAGAAVGLVSNLSEAIGTACEIAKNEDLLGLKARYETLAGNQNHERMEQRQVISPVDVVEPLPKRAYESLKDFIHEQESEACAEMVKDCLKARRRGCIFDATSFVFFKDVMEREQEDQGSGEVNWVLKNL